MHSHDANDSPTRNAYHGLVRAVVRAACRARGGSVKSKDLFQIYDAHPKFKGKDSLTTLCDVCKELTFNSKKRLVTLTESIASPDICLTRTRPQRFAQGAYACKTARRHDGNTFRKVIAAFL